MGTRANQPNPSHHMKTTMSQGETVSHTPTPWETGKGISYPHARRIIANLPDGRLKVAECYHSLGHSGDANAEFIVNAVNCHAELLEACKGVFALFAQPLETSSHTQWALWNDPETVPEWRALRDAIDRATTQKEGAE